MKKYEYWWFWILLPFLILGYIIIFPIVMVVWKLARRKEEKYEYEDWPND